MNLHKICRFGIAIALGACLLTVPAHAAETEPKASASAATATENARHAVRLRSISFSGAALSEPLSEEITSYRLIPSGNGGEISLVGCDAYSSEAKINAILAFDATEGAQVYRITVTLGKETAEYQFFLPQTQKDRTGYTDDASLSALSIPQGELSPKFSKQHTTYTVYLPSDTTQLTIEAVPSSSGATVNAPREVRLNKGQEMKLIINVTAADGATTESYTIRVKRVKKTQAEVEALKKDPNFKGLAQQSVLKHPVFYIILGGTAAAAGIILLFFWLRRRRRQGNQPTKR